MSDAQAVSPRKVQQALAYMAGLHSDDPARVQEVSGQLQRWRGKSSEHERAWQEAERRWQLIHRLTPQLRGVVAPEPVDLSRRRLLRQGGGLLALIGCATGLGGWWWRQPQFDQVLLTEHAQPARSVLLPDGSQLLLAAQSNVQVRYSNGQREVMLAHGNVFFDVKGGRLAGRADGDDGMGAVLEVEVHEFAEAVPVKTPLCIHGSDQCHHTARNHETAPAGKRER